MGKPKIAILVALGIAAGIVIGSVPAFSQQEEIQKATRVQIEALDLNSDDKIVDVDVARKGFSSGDGYMFRTPLLDPDTRARTGSSSANCTALHVSKNGATIVFLCDLESVFADGTIVATGSFKYAPGVEGGVTTITGGTGNYEGAAGELALKFNKNSTSLSYDFTTR
jgi:hypothetical protein